MLARGADHGLLKIHEQNLTVNVAVAGDGIKNAECFTIHWMSLLFLSYENWIMSYAVTQSCRRKKNAGHARYGTAA
jgi:hypothetical protein